MNDIIHRGETMLISISGEDFPVTDLSDVVLTIKRGRTYSGEVPDTIGTTFFYPMQVT